MIRLSSLKHKDINLLIFEEVSYTNSSVCIMPKSFSTGNTLVKLSSATNLELFLQKTGTICCLKVQQSPLPAYIYNLMLALLEWHNKGLDLYN